MNTKFIVKVSETSTSLVACGMELTIPLGRPDLIGLPKRHEPDPGSGEVVQPRVAKIVDRIEEMFPCALEHNDELWGAIADVVETLK